MANSSLIDFMKLVIGVQVHAAILQFVEPMHDMRATSTDIAISILILDIVIDILLVPEKISQVRGRHVQSSSHLHIHPLKGFVRSIAVRVEVLVYTVIL